MKNHPLFNGNETSKTREAIDIRYINVVQFEGGKRVTMTDQWLPEQLMTPEHLYAAVGPGQFELIGRDERGKVLDREIITIRPPKTAQNQAPSPAPTAASMPVATPMQGGGMEIPPNADPLTAMMFMMINAQTQNMMALREESRFAAQNQTQLMGAFLQSQSGMVTGLANAFASHGNGNAGGGLEAAGTAFIKGVEAMGSLFNGFKEGQGNGNGNGQNPATGEQPLNWADVSRNILESLKQIADIARTTAGNAPAAPVVPPGEPGI